MGSTEFAATDQSEPCFSDRLLDCNCICNGCSDDCEPSWNGLWIADDFDQHPRLSGVHRMEKQTKVVPKWNGWVWIALRTNCTSQFHCVTQFLLLWNHYTTIQFDRRFQQPENLSRFYTFRWINANATEIDVGCPTQNSFEGFFFSFYLYFALFIILHLHFAKVLFFLIMHGLFLRINTSVWWNYSDYFRNAQLHI